MKKILSLSMSNESARATTSHSLTLYELRFFWFSISEFQFLYNFTNHKKSNEINIPVNEFYKIFKLKQTNTYKMIKKIAKKMSLIQLNLIDDKNKKFEFYTIFPKFIYKKGVITLEINQSIKNHFLNLKKNYFITKLSTLSMFKYKYTWFFYAHCKSLTFVDKTRFLILSIETIKNKLYLNTLSAYKRYSNIKDKIIVPAIKEINKKTNLKIIFKEIKKNQKVISLKFTIHNQRKMK